jgi:hypothetical protein
MILAETGTANRRTAILKAISLPSRTAVMRDLPPRAEPGLAWSAKPSASLRRRTAAAAIRGCYGGGTQERAWISAQLASPPSVGTVMARSHTPLSVWFWSAYLVSSQTPGMSAVQLQRQLGLSRYETAFQILHKLRAVSAAV